MSGSFDLTPSSTGWGDPNVLLRTLSGQQTSEVQRNQLLNQQTQQTIGANDMGMMGRAAAGLLSLPDETARAAAYPGVVQQLQQSGFGKNAPSIYPGEGALRGFMARSLPVDDQIKLGMYTPPGLTDALRGIYGGGAGPPGPGTATAPPATGGGGGGDFATNMATSESGGKPSIINPSGYTGLYQFGKQRLADLGYYTPASGEDMGDNKTWAGRVSVPGFNVTDQASFAANPDAQKAVFQTHLGNIDKAIADTPGADRFDQNGLRAVAHLGGTQGMQRFVTSGGTYNPADANGTRLSDYYRKFSGGGSPTAGPVIVGDSLASSGGLGGSGTVGALPSAVRAQVAQGVANGTYQGRDVVVSSGASNAPGDTANVEAQLQALRDPKSGAKSVTLVGVGPTVETKNPGTNATLQALALKYGATFVPLPAGQMSQDGVHPTAEGYKTLRSQVASAQPAAAPARAQAPSIGDVAQPPEIGSAANVVPGAGPVRGVQVAGPAGVVSGVQGGAGAPTIATATRAPTPGLAATPNVLFNPNVQTARPPVAPNAMVPPGQPGTQPAGAGQPPGGPAQPTAQPAAQPAQGALPHAADVPTGTSSPQYQRANQMLQQALQLETTYPADPRAKLAAAALRQQAQVILQSDSVVQTQEGQLHTLTGKLDETAKPLPHYVYDPAQHAYIDTSGTNKPEFEPAQRDSAVAQRAVMELGPKVANGTATPQEQAQYATAVETYRQPVLRENPVTKETVRVNTRELPAGFPEPPGIGGSGAPGGGAPGGGGPQVVMPGLSPAQQQVERDPAAYKVSESQYDRDSKEIAAIGDAGRQAQADQIRIKEMQDVLQKFNSGRGTEAATAAKAWFNSWAPAGLSGWEKESANLSGSTAAEAFSKLALGSAGAQERSVLGNRGGFQAIRMFQAANPNINLQDATNKAILDMQLITNQANQDYSQAALSHFADNEKKFSQTHQYDSLAQFDRNWNQQRNPQVYAAAMGAISGQDPSQWARGLSDAEYARALQVVERAKPGAIVNGKSGRIVVQPAAPTPPPGFTVVQ